MTKDETLEAVSFDVLSYVCDNELLDDKYKIIEACYKSSNIDLWVDKIDEKLRCDKEVMLAVSKFGIYDIISDELLDDKDIAINLIKYDTSNYLYISSRLQNDKEFILEVIDIFEHVLNWIDIDDYKYFSMPSILKYLPSSLLNDKEFMNRVISINERLIVYIGDLLKEDNDFKNLYNRYKDYLNKK